MARMAEVIMQVSDTHIQWQYQGDTTWQDLIALSTLRGADGIDGREVEFSVSDTHIQWRYLGDENYTNLIEVASLIGEKGTGISSMLINDLGELVITYTDLTEQNLGKLLKSYLVQFFDYNGYLLNVQHVVFGQDAILPNSPTREGYNFISWDKNVSNITSNLNINPTYEIKKIHN